MTGSNNPHIPQNLAEALAGTPLTYLVPTQSLVKHVQPVKVNVLASDNQITDDVDSFYRTLADPKLQKHFTDSLGIGQAMEDTDIHFGTLSRPFSDSHSKCSNTVHSLFDGLDGVAAEIVRSVPLIDETELLPLNSMNVPPTANTTLTSRTTLEQNPTITSFSSQPLTQPPHSSSPVVSRPASSHHVTVSQPIELHTEKKREAPQPAKQDAQIKKRKSDIGVQHLQIEAISLNQLIDLVQNKIGITDEQAEFESSDLWIELPNTDHILHNTAINGIDELLLKLNGTSLVESIPYEVLDRIQQLMMKSIRYAPEVLWSGVNVEEDPTYKLALNVLKAISTLLTVFNLQRGEKKLYLDDYLTDALTFLYRFVEDYVIKLSTTEELKRLGSLSIIRKILDQLCLYLSANQTNDTLITKLEYMAIMIFFHQSDRYIMPFKWSSMNLLITIFENISDQRSFIIDEVITSMDRLSTHKINSRQVSLPDSVNVQLVTVLILNLINCLNIKTVTYSNELIIPGKQLLAHEKAERLKEDQRFFEAVKHMKKERECITSSIASSLITKIVNNPTANIKASFELFLQDLLTLVTLPEFTAAESLLFEIAKYLMFNSENQSSIVETHLIEMIGLVGSKMLQIRGSDDPPQQTVLRRTIQNATLFKALTTQKTEGVTRAGADLFLAKWIDALVTDTHSSDVFLDEKTMSVLSQVLVFYYNGKKTPLFSSIDLSITLVNTKDLYGNTLLYSNFISLYNNFLNHLLNSVEHPKIKSRTRALKNLAHIISQEDRFINVPQVKNALSNRISDPSALVRLAVLEIFQQCIRIKPWMITDFYQTILLTSDKSLAVRKKSIELSNDIIEQTRDIGTQVYALEKILRRLEDDEESVLELTRSILVNMFNIDPTFSPPDGANHLKSLSGLCSLLLKLISRSTKNWELFESFLFESVIRNTDHNKNIHDKLMTICQALVSVLFSIVIDNIDTASAKSMVEECLGLLSILSKSEKPFISQEQLLSLQPYLTSETSGNSTTFYSLVILKNTLVHTKSLREQFLVGAQSSLLKRLTKFNTKEMDQAMPSVWILSEMRGDTSKIANAAASCLLMLRVYIDKAVSDQLTENDQRLLRLIYLTGSFGRYCDLEKNRQVFIKQKKLGLKEKETVLSLITKNILIFTKPKVNRQIRRAAVRNLIHVATTHSKLFMSEPILKIMDQEFSGDQSDFKTIMVQGLLEFLEKEEKDAQKKSRMKKESDGVDVQVFHGDSKTFENDGICASLVQRYMEPVLELCLDVNTDNSYLAVKYLRFIVNLGFANPRICIPTVIALQVSEIPYIRMIGIELHKELHERHESLIDSSYIHGLKEAVRYRMKLGDVKNGNHEFFTKFYGVIEESKTSRKRLLTQLVKSFNFNMETVTLTDFNFLQNYIGFLCPSILQCEFTNYDEVFLIVDGIEMNLNSHDSTMKHLIQQPSSDTDKLGAIVSCLNTLHKFVKCLRLAYRIPHGMEKSSLKSQKCKMHEKPQLNVIIYNGDAGMGSLVEQLMNEIV